MFKNVKHAIDLLVRIIAIEQKKILSSVFKITSGEIWMLRVREVWKYERKKATSTAHLSVEPASSDEEYAVHQVSTKKVNLMIRF